MNKEDKKRCDICEIPYFERNNYYYGKLMTVRDYFDEQCYFNEKRWLINRAVHGWGVVCGLDVRTIDGETDKVIVTPGLAIDCCGREILVCEEQTVPLKPEVSECYTPKEQAEQHLAICLEYLDCKTEAIHLPPIACDQKEKCEFNRIRDSFKLSAVSFEVLQQTPFCPIEDKEKSLHQYLCDRLRPYEGGCPKCPESHCVILATVKVDSNCNIINDSLDLCTHRKLIYSNPILYDLIECFHGNLPRVKTIDWSHNGILSLNELKIKVGEGLTVTFDQQMVLDTINKHTFLFAVIITEASTGYRQLKYISSKENIIVKKDIDDFNGKMKKVVTKATFVVDPTWITEELEGYSELLLEADKYGADFEIILRGSSILSKEGKALDGAFIRGELPSGNGFQGSDFVSWFSVEPGFAKAKKEE